VESLPPLPADRIVLRQLGAADVDALFEVFGDPAVTRFWSFPAFRSRDEAARLLADIDRLRADDELFQWGIARRDDDLVIGTVTLCRVDARHLRAEVGFALASRAWGSGFASEAVNRLVEHAFEDRGLERLEADVDPRNERSLRLLERLGFVREGLLRERWRVAGEVQDSVMLGLLRRERPAANGPR